MSAVCIVGVGESTDIGSTPHCSALELQAQASRAALRDAGLARHDIDGLITQTGGRMAAINFAEYFGIEPRFVDSTFIGGASNVAHLDMASALIHARICETILVSYGTTPRQGEYVASRPNMRTTSSARSASAFRSGSTLCVPRGTCTNTGRHASSSRDS